MKNKTIYGALFAAMMVVALFSVAVDAAVFKAKADKTTMVGHQKLSHTAGTPDMTEQKTSARNMKAQRTSDALLKYDADVDMNGRVDSQDLAYVLSYYGTESCLDKGTFCVRSDVNKNGVINNQDVKLVISSMN